MTDRQPRNAHRVKITPESGGRASFATWEYADDPITEGTPLNKANLLDDEAAGLLTPGKDDPTPNDAFLRLAKGENLLTTVHSDDELAQVKGTGVIKINEDNIEGDTWKGLDGVILQVDCGVERFQIARNGEKPMYRDDDTPNYEHTRDSWPWQRLAVGPTILEAKFSASGWSGSAPYTQTVTVEGVRASDNPIADVKFTTGNNSTAMNEASNSGFVTYIETQNGKVVATCVSAKPTVDLTFRLLIIR